MTDAPTTTQAKRITILYTDAGGGHKAAARALQNILERDGRYQVKIINIYTEIIPNLDIFRFTPYQGEEIYNRFIQGKGWTGIFCLLFYSIVVGSIHLQWPIGLRQLKAYWEAEKPDLVISVIPMMNTLLSRSLKPYKIPFMVLLTDLREPQRYVWMPKDKTTSIICGTKAAYQDAKKLKHPEELITDNAGLVIHPKFYELPELERSTEREKHGLKADLATACMLYGGSGSQRMVDLAKALSELDVKFQIIFLCGNHQDIAQQIRDLQLPYPHLILGYTQEVPYYMRLSDFFIGKPGPGSLTEALVMKLPVILDRKNLLLQERYNIRWVQEQKLGCAFKNIKGFKQCVTQLLSGDTLAQTQAQTQALENQAIFNMPKLVDNLLAGSAIEKTE